MNKELKKIFSKLSKSVVGIGLDDELSYTLESNDNILELDIINIQKKKKGKLNNKTKNKSRKINIKKLKKIYNKKSVEYVVCNYEVIKKYFRYFISDSIYMNNNKLYLYGTSMEDIKEIKKKYKRYNTLIKVTDEKKYFIIEIDNKESKNNFFKDKLYFIVDTYNYLVDIIGDFLIN